jgi:death-on-curing protein
MTEDDLPTPADIIAIHDEIQDEYDLKYTGAAVAAPRLRFREIVADAAEHDDYWFRAAFLLRKVLTAHLFEDGNKRTAWVTMREYLARNNAEPAERGEDAERVLRRIRRYDVDELAVWLETGDLDRDRLEP